MDKFILERKRTNYVQTDKWPKVRVRQETYEILADWANQTGTSLTEMAERAVTFAQEHALFVDA